MTIKYYNLAKNILFPINRSITGKGTKLTLKIIKKYFPTLKIKKIKSGKKVFDWKVPEEWNVKDAYVLDKYGKKIVDFKKNNLHLVGYSIPIEKYINRDQLLQNIYSLKKQPNAIPYVTSYYKKKWGFCMKYNEVKKILSNYKKMDLFKVVIKSKFLKNGNINYGELVLKSKNPQEILISTYICHPSMANNELSGPIVSMSLINYFKKLKNLKKTLRFIFIPETIGSISYLSKNLNHLKKKVIGGYNLSCIGDERNHSCMFTKYGNLPSDEAIIEAYKKLKIKKFKIYSFLQRGSDERQYNSPGVDLPISSIFRSKYLTYKEYHTSLDDFNLVTPKGIKGGYSVAKTAIKILEDKIIPQNIILCEPFMNKKKLYSDISIKRKKDPFKKYVDFLQYSDGRNTLSKICRLINLNYKEGKKVYSILKAKKLII